MKMKERRSEILHKYYGEEGEFREFIISNGFTEEERDEIMNIIIDYERECLFFNMVDIVKEMEVSE